MTVFQKACYTVWTETLENKSTFCFWDKSIFMLWVKESEEGRLDSKIIQMMCFFFPVRKEAARSWRVGGTREPFLLNVLLRGSDKQMKESDISFDGQVDLRGAKNKNLHVYPRLAQNKERFHPPHQTTAQQTSLLRCKWDVSLLKLTSAAARENGDILRHSFQQTKDLCEDVEKFNPCWRKYHLHTSCFAAALDTEVQH